MTPKERREMEKLRALLEAERERADKAMQAYKETLYELVDCQMRLKFIEEILNEDQA